MMKTSDYESINTLLVLILVFGVLVWPVSSSPSQDPIVGISSATSVPVDELEAVGQIPGCTATLINQSLVLTAAHCVCSGSGSSRVCVQRTNFTLNDVYPVDNPATPGDESLYRTDVTIGGTVRIHPEFELRGWAREDYAIIELDTPINSRALVTPIPVEEPHNSVLAGDTLTLVGFGMTGSLCNNPSEGKRKASVAVHDSSWGGIHIEDPVIYSCPADSGGPALNSNNKVAGVASWGDFAMNSYYRPTAYAYNWIFGIPEPGWGTCTWVEIEKAGINSHQAGNAWCPAGSFITGIDLDQDASLDAHDSPVIGQVVCCNLAGAQSTGWTSCSWNKVPDAASHQQRRPWCSQGTYLVAVDLDGPRDYNEYDTPLVGQAMCCGLKDTDYALWGSSGWKGVETEGIMSHQPNYWCWPGSFITQYDLDANQSWYPLDSPGVGQAKCSRPRPAEESPISGVELMYQVGVYRDSTGYWYLNTNKDGIADISTKFGKSGDISVVGDWDGDGTSDVGVFRSSTGYWHLDTNNDGYANANIKFGKIGDIPVVGDWNEDNISDIGVFRSSTGYWYLDSNKDGIADYTFQFGKTGDSPVVGKWI